MNASIQTLMHQVIDYAGLFPPAQLPLDAAVKNYFSYLSGSEKWALSNFVIPARRVEEFVDIWKSLPSSPASSLSILISATEDNETSVKHFTEIVKTSLDAITDLPQGISVSSLEIKLSSYLFVDDRLEHVLSSTKKAILEQEYRNLISFFEIPVDFMYERNLSKFVQVSSEIFSEAEHFPTGVKFRTGGLKPENFPPPPILSQGIQICAGVGFKMKATAGLHKPLYHFDKELGVWRYGFLNVILAMILTRKFKLARQLVMEILTERNLTNFSFEDGVRWKNFSLTTSEVEQFRQDVLNFGSCDFVEPLDELRKLSLL